MKQLALLLNWSELWEQTPYWKDDGRGQGWILDQQQKLECGLWVKHKSGRVGNIHTIHCGELICSVEFKEDGTTKKSERWYPWEVTRLSGDLIGG